MAEFVITGPEGRHRTRWTDGELSGSPLVHAIVQGLIEGGAPAGVAGLFSADAGLAGHLQAYGTVVHALEHLGFTTMDIVYEGDPLPLIPAPADADP